MLFVLAIHIYTHKNNNKKKAKKQQKTTKKHQENQEKHGAPIKLSIDRFIPTVIHPIHSFISYLVIYSFIYLFTFFMLVHYTYINL
ncbi:hypothetical protein BCR42DRAFT_400062 [Absidia repens]|uniref:Uncharacterized protein n=1 Tax=Absidia repens TaxID=90262 RepID=A0A1X2J0R4_9FUNG|nr:hypothetical protein BCR42DRAFT_400062 [Absidia repens]